MLGDVATSLPRVPDCRPPARHNGAGLATPTRLEELAAEADVDPWTVRYWLVGEIMLRTHERAKQHLAAPRERS
jgi:hypothetical protein